MEKRRNDDIQSFMATYKDMTKLYESANADKPDSEVEARALAVAHPLQDRPPLQRVLLCWLEQFNARTPRALQT